MGIHIIFILYLPFPVSCAALVPARRTASFHLSRHVASPRIIPGPSAYPPSPEFQSRPLRPPVYPFPILISRISPLLCGSISPID